MSNADNILPYPTGGDDKAPIEMASEWAAYLQSGLANTSALSEFRIWLQHSTENEDAFHQIAQAWEDVGLAAMAEELSRQDAHQTGEVIRLDPGNDIDTSDTLLPNRRWFFPAGLAATAALFFGLGVWSLSSPSAKVFEHTTSTGEIRTIILTDGSKITLGGSTSLKSSFSDQSRQVTLNSGRAFFDVSPDIDRPFTVSAADTRIRVLGTSFDVAFRSEDLHVSVEHGRVDVSIIENGSVTDSSLLTDGMQISAAYTGVMGPKNNFDTNTLSWRQGQLAYVDTRLEDIVEEVNRYRTPSQKIKIADAALENLRVSFSVAADQTDTLLSGLEAILPIEVERSATGTTIIRASRED